MASASKTFVQGLPKVELHMHIEGVLTPALRWKISQRNGLEDIANSLEELTEKYQSFYNMLQNGTPDLDLAAGAFFDLLYGGYKVLKTEIDFYDCAMAYYEEAARMNVRYAELFVEFQALELYGVSVDIQMAGYRRAQLEAEEKFGEVLNGVGFAVLQVKSAWILSFARAEDPKDALRAYEHALKHRDIIIGFGLAGWSDGTSPMKFDEVYTRARTDDFKLTIHCDPEVPNIHDHIRECATQLGGEGVDRIDHGTNTADKQELIDLVRQRNLGLTICPWSALGCLSSRSDPEKFLYNDIIRRLFDNDVKISLNSDDPAIIRNKWISHAFEDAASGSQFTEQEMRKLSLNAVETSWAPETLKAILSKEISSYNIAKI